MIRTLFSIIILFLATGLMVSASAQESYDELRSELIEKQETTRSQIENLQEQIDSYLERLGYATERYDQMYQQYEELTRVIALQQEKINQMNRERRQILDEIELVEAEQEALQARLNELIDRYQSTLSYIYKYGRTQELALLLTSSSVNQLMIR